MEIRLEDIAEQINGKIIGNKDLVIKGISDLKYSEEGFISFILHPKYIEEAKKTKASALICDFDLELENKTIVKVENTKLAYIKCIQIFYPENKNYDYISKNAYISKSAKIGRNVYIGDFVVIKENVVIGDNCYIGENTFIGENTKIDKNTLIYPNVSIYKNTEIGENTIIHSGSVIGSDGFGFVEDKGEIIKVPQIGYVKIGNNVEIGANCTIDRGSFGPTIISDNVKLDNLIQVAHNVFIGEGTIIAAQTGIAGSTRIGKYCLIGGQVGFVDHITIGNFVKIGAQAGVSKNIKDGEAITGTPARPIIKIRKIEAYLQKLEDLFKRMKKLEDDIKK